MHPKNKKKLTRAIGIGIFIYVIIYAVLSVNGKYAMDISGKTTLFDIGWAAHDIYVWEPKHLTLLRNNWNYLGLLFMPLVEIDRLVWHKNIKEAFQ